MPEFAILTNRKRALIALVHSVAFLLLALRGFASRKAGVSLHSGVTADFVLLVIFLLVASILLWLAGISRCAMERIYFALCTGGASFGLLRVLFGDTALPSAQYLRVLMLLCAVAMGTRIWRLHGEELLPD
jgi:peptidoglycan/LPS O-acetylase OafA/YrhL